MNCNECLYTDETMKESNGHCYMFKDKPTYCNCFKVNTYKIAKELHNLQKIENDGRGVSCVRAIIKYLQFGHYESAKNVCINEFDKIRNYPKIKELCQKVFDIKEWHLPKERDMFFNKYKGEILICVDNRGSDLRLRGVYYIRKYKEPFVQVGEDRWIKDSCQENKKYHINRFMFLDKWNAYRLKGIDPIEEKKFNPLEYEDSSIWIG